MRTRFVAFAVLSMIALGSAAPVFAQGSDGTLVGYVRDDTGAVLPGVAVSATSPVLIGTRTVVTDAQGSFRLLNLPPGQYVLTAELVGFTNYRQEGIVMRAGATFTQNIQLKLSTVQETVNVIGASPMLEVGTPTHAVNISGDFQREIPIQARKSYTDFLEMTTGVISRPLDDNSGRMLYIGHGVDSWSYVVQIEGSSAVNYQDAGAQNVSMSNELISDVNVKIAGIPAAEPMGSGLVINIVTKSGGDQFSGAASVTYQPLKWNGDNVPEGQSATADAQGRGQPTKQQVQQPDLAFGGPISRGKAWFFGAYRYQDTETAVGFTTQQVQQFQALVPGWTPFNSTSSGHQPYAKVTAQLSSNHQLSGFWQYDRLEGGFHRTIYYEPITIFAQGGSLFGMKLTDAWGTNTTTTFQASYNNKSGADEGTFSRLPGSGPQIDIHQDTFLSRGLVTGTGAFGTGGNVQSIGLSPASMLIFRGDLTHHKQGWGGSHDFQTGFFAAPRLHRDNLTRFVNDGFVYQERALIDPTNLSGGTYAFHERFVSPIESQSIKSRDRDIGVYVQDSWKPNQRLTITPGLRVDFVRRFDGIFNVVRMKDTTIGPRFSMTYLATEDARNVIRFSAGRVHEQVNGRDFSSSRAAGGGRDQAIDRYYNRDGSLATQVLTPAAPRQLLGVEFDPNLHQPYTDEIIGGFQKQFGGRVAVDASLVHRRIADVYQLVDVNGIYPEAPGQPFIGFGKVDPARGIYFQQTNSTWSKYVYTGLEVTVSKQLSNRYQFLVGIHRQWQHQNGTWNPTDPARFIQPDAFENDKGLWMTRGNYDHNSYEAHGLGNAYGPTWKPYTIRTAMTWLAPAGIVIAGSYDITAGPWSGAILTRVAASDPRFGPALIPIVGGTQPNPLATTNRFKFATRAEGQVLGDPIRILNVKVGKKFEFGGTRNFEIATNIFNVFNTSRSWLFNYYGGEYDYNPNHLQPFVRANPLSANLSLTYRF
jgi:hypothetical protein